MLLCKGRKHHYLHYFGVPHGRHPMRWAQSRGATNEFFENSNLLEMDSHQTSLFTCFWTHRRHRYNTLIFIAFGEPRKF